MRREWEPEDLIACWTLVEHERELVAYKRGATHARVAPQKVHVGHAPGARERSRFKRTAAIADVPMWRSSYRLEARP